MEWYANFHFLRPLWLLLFIPAVFLIWALAAKKLGHSSWEKVCDSELLPHILIRGKGNQNNYWLYLLTTVLSLMILALAGPSWERLPQPVFRTESSLVILLDMSQSMNAADLKPSRLERAKFKLIDILKARKEGETALVVYAGDAFTVTPLTNDKDTIVSQLPALTTDIMPIQGANAANAISLAVELLKQAGHGRGDILLMTDEADNVTSGLAAKEAYEQGYRLSVMMVGTEEGAPIPTRAGGFLNDRTGEIIVAKVDKAPLNDLAVAGGGYFVELSLDDLDIQQLNTLFEREVGDQFEQQSGLKTDTWREEGPWLVLLLLPFIAMGFRKGFILSFLIVMLPLPRPVQALDWNELWLNQNQRAHRALNNGEGAKAAEEFTDPEWKAAAQYQSGQYEESLSTMQEMMATKDLYNKGNALAKLGRYEEAIQQYNQVLENEPEHEDAEYNKKLVEEALEKQQEQQQQQNQSDQDQENEQDEQQQEEQEQSSQQEQQQSEEDQSQQNAEQQDSSQEQQQAQRDEQQNDRQEQQEESESEEDEQQARDSENRETQQLQEQIGENDTDSSMASAESETEQEYDEQQQADEQWLRGIPDDPGGLLKRKFLYQYRQRAQTNPAPEKNW